MSDLKRPDNLSQSAEQRKAKMLVELQGQLASIHRRRKMRLTIAKSAGYGLVVVLAGFLASQFVFPPPVNFRPNLVVKTQPQEMPKANRKLSFTEAVNNRQGISGKYLVTNSRDLELAARCLVSNGDRQLTFETIGDSELIDMLAACGQPAVLGRINGKAVLIPTPSYRE